MYIFLLVLKFKSYGIVYIVYGSNVINKNDHLSLLLYVRSFLGIYNGVLNIIYNNDH